MDAGIVLVEGAVMIRPTHPADAAQAYAALHESTAELSVWLPGLAAAHSPDVIEARIQADQVPWTAGTDYHFAVIDVQTEAYLGGCGLTRIHPMHRFANLYYWIRSSRSGEGIATIATRLVVHYGLVQLGLNRIEIVVAVGNRASIRVAEKVGATREGILRSRIALPHGISDALMFSLIPADLRSNVATTAPISVPY